MKKLFIVILMLLTICGCSDKNKTEPPINNNTPIENNITTNNNTNIKDGGSETNKESNSNNNSNNNKPGINKNQNTNINNNPIDNDDSVINQQASETPVENSTKKPIEKPFEKPKTEKSEYECPFGYTLNFNKCYKTYTPTIKYTCDYGTVDNGVCIYDKSVFANVTYSCNNGYELIGNSCKMRYTALSFNPNNFSSETMKISAFNNFINNCNNLGGIRDGNYCYAYYTQVPVANYNCDGKNGVLAGNKCVSVITKEAHKSYSCNDGDFLTSELVCKNEINATKKISAN